MTILREHIDPMSAAYRRVLPLGPALKPIDNQPMVSTGELPVFATQRTWVEETGMETRETHWG